jgi:prefoldin subunit 5
MKELVEALFRLKQNNDFKLIETWLHEIRNEYLSIWKNERTRLEHMQGRYSAIDDLIQYIDKAEENLKKIKEREKEMGYERISPI